MEIKKLKEITYYQKLPFKERDWIKSKPFSLDFNQRSEGGKLLASFSSLLQIIDLPSSSQILDLGVGSGWTSIFLAKFGFQVTGTDISEDMIKIAKDKTELEKLKITFVVGDFENSNLFQKESFEGVIFFDSLHHSFDLQRSLTNAFCWLKPRGKIYISEPNWWHKFQDTSKKATKYDITEKGFDLMTLKKMLKTAGFKNIQQFYPLTCVYGPPLKDWIKHITLPLFQRLIFKYFKTAILIRAEKP